MTSSMKKRITQIRQGQVPKGYRLTRLGIAPNDWMMFRIGDCLERVERPVDVQANKQYTQIGIRSHGKGLFYKEPVTGAELGNKAVFWIEPNCFILNIVFAWEQAIGKTTQAEEGMIGSHRFPMYRPINNRVDTDYLIYYFLTKRGREILEAASPGGAGRNKTLGQDRFLKSKIVLPPLAEQRKIAKILATQDKVIELKKKLLEETKKRKKALLKMLMNPTETKRLKAASPCGEAVSCRFGDNNKLVFMGDIGFAYTGIIGKGKEDFGKGDAWYIPFLNVLKNTKIDLGNLVRVNVSKSEKQNVVQKGDLFFNISSETPDEVGLCAFLANKAERTYLNSFCLGFRLKPDAKIEPHYLAEWFNSCYGRRIMRSLAQGVTRYNLSREGLLSTSINLPPLPIQRYIAAILSAADREIDLLRQDLEQEKQKKKTLMQLLLTGIVRVKEAAGCRFSTQMKERT